MRWRVGYLLPLIIACGCATAPRVMSYHPEDTDEIDERVWPAAPETGRIRYAGQLIGEVNFRADGDDEQGAGTRLLRWIAGLGNGKQDVLQLIRPQSGLVDSGGRILVSDAGLQAVVVFDETQAILQTWTEAGAGVDFHTPVGIAEGQDGRIYVADAKLGFVAVLTSDGRPAGQLAAEELLRPTGLAIDFVSGAVFVADSAAHDIKVFRDGRHVDTLGRHGEAPGEFNGPTHLSVDGGYLYVTDTLNARVQVLTPDGGSVRVIGKRGLFVGNLVRPKGVTTDTDGNIYVVEAYYDHLLIFDQQGQLLLPIGGPGSGVGEFFLPSGLWSDQSGRIFIADMFNGRVVVFQYLGAGA